MQWGRPDVVTMILPPASRIGLVLHPRADHKTGKGHKRRLTLRNQLHPKGTEENTEVVRGAALRGTVKPKTLYSTLFTEFRGHPAGESIQENLAEQVPRRLL